MQTIARIPLLVNCAVLWLPCQIPSDFKSLDWPCEMGQKESHALKESIWQQTQAVFAFCPLMWRTQLLEEVQHIKTIEPLTLLSGSRIKEKLCVCMVLLHERLALGKAQEKGRGFSVRWCWHLEFAGTLNPCVIVGKDNGSGEIYSWPVYKASRCWQRLRPKKLKTCRNSRSRPFGCGEWSLPFTQNLFVWNKYLELRLKPGLLQALIVVQLRPKSRNTPSTAPPVLLCGTAAKCRAAHTCGRDRIPLRQASFCPQEQMLTDFSQTVFLSPPRNLKFCLQLGDTDARTNLFLGERFCGYITWFESVE